MRELSHMIYNVAEEDVQRARNQLKASMLFSQDGPSGACPTLARSQLHQRQPITPPPGGPC